MQLLFSLRWRVRDTQALVVRLAEDLHSLRRDLLPKGKKRGGGGSGGGRGECGGGGGGGSGDGGASGGRGASAEYEKALHQLQDCIELFYIFLIGISSSICTVVCAARRTGWSTSRRVCCAGSATCRRWTQSATCGSSVWSSNNNAWRASCSSSCSSKIPSRRAHTDDREFFSCSRVSVA